MSTVPNMRWTGLACALAFCLLAALAYASALDNPLLFDDEALIGGNDRLTLTNAPKLLSSAYFDLFPGQLTSWRPVSVLSYMINRTLFGDWYPGWRMVYLLMHVANALLLTHLVIRWGTATLPALAGGVVFLLHPVHTEVINQISYNEEPMVTLLVLLALLALARTAGGSVPGWRRWAFATAAFLPALGCKESAVMLLPVTAAINLSTPAGGTPAERRQGWAFLSALAGITLVYLVLRFRVLTNPVDTRAMALSARSIAGGVPTLLMLVAVYLGRFLWPVGLSAVHDFRAPGWGAPSVWIGVLIVLALAGATVWGIARRRPRAVLPAVVFAAAMLPLGYAILFTGEIYAYDRYLYLPSVGLAWYLASGLDALSRLGPTGRRLSLAIPLVAAVAFIPLDWQRHHAWSDPVLFWEDNVGKAPGNAGAWATLGWVHLGRGDTTEAIAAYQQAVKLKPDYADACFNLALLRQQSGRLAQAEALYQQTLESDPRHVGALLNLGAIRLTQGRWNDAIAIYGRVLAIDPENGQVRRFMTRMGIDPGDSESPRD